MGRRLASVVSMVLTDQKGFPGTQWPIIWFWSKLKILISSGEDVVEKGYQPHFFWWLLCRVFCLYFSHSWEHCKISWLTKLLLICHTSRTKLLCHLLGRKSSFCIFLLMCDQWIFICCCFRGASSPAVKSMCESSSWPSNLCKQGSPWHLKNRGSIMRAGTKKETPWIGTFLMNKPSSSELCAILHPPMLGDYSA